MRKTIWLGEDLEIIGEKANTVIDYVMRGWTRNLKIWV